MLMRVKKEIRILGIDDAPFTDHSKKTFVVGIVMRGGKYFDGMVMTEIDVDGLDATSKISNMIKSCKYFKELRVVMFKGVTIGGFNVIDIEELHKNLKLPIIVISRKKPNLRRIMNALKNVSHSTERWETIKKAGKVHMIKIKNNKNIYFQFKGIEKDVAKEIILLSCTNSLIPEPLRMAHMIASAIVRGECGGRA